MRIDSPPFGRGRTRSNSSATRLAEGARTAFARMAGWTPTTIQELDANWPLTKRLANTEAAPNMEPGMEKYILYKRNLVREERILLS